ncbi:hypothetical protein ACPEEZ_02435 [Frigoribacterium sp. 2-23]|uniref:hypothetical protein n=1 Tax=Frigoribacterium sp. 2-23 TaxID=3415006 RepID=UPI003C6F4718
MTICRACARRLEPRWKFCVWCGVPVETATPRGGAAPVAAPPRGGLVLPIVFGGVGIVVGATVAGLVTALALGR